MEFFYAIGPYGESIAALRAPNVDVARDKFTAICPDGEFNVYHMYHYDDLLVDVNDAILELSEQRRQSLNDELNSMLLAFDRTFDASALYGGMCNMLKRIDEIKNEPVPLIVEFHTPWTPGGADDMLLVVRPESGMLSKSLPPIWETIIDWETYEWMRGHINRASVTGGDLVVRLGMYNGDTTIRTRAAVISESQYLGRINPEYTK